MSECRGRHTIFQADGDGEWVCPACGSEDFVIERSGFWECDRVHPDDEMQCGACRESFTGRVAMQRLAKKWNVEPCPHCRGRGVIPKVTVKA